jgi:peptidyl-prolyl cis-trans isomerase C
MTKLFQRLAIAGLISLAIPTLAFAADQTDALSPKQNDKTATDEPFVIINGIAKSKAYADVVRGDLARSGREPSDENVRNVLIDNEILANEAVRQGLDKPAEVQALLDLQRKDTLGKLLINNYAKAHPVSETRIQAEYDKLKAKVGDTEYHTRHILVPTEAEANDLTKQLKAKPAKFEELAKKYSKDSGSAANGGDLGWMAPTNLVPPFSEAMMQLKKGEITAKPIQTQFGWHVIQLIDTRKLQFPPFDQVKERIANKLMQDDFRAFEAELRAKANIVVPGAK